MPDDSLAGDEILRRKFGTIDIPVADTLSDTAVRFIEGADFFFIATSNRRGECDASYRHKGDGVPAVKVLDNRTIVFPQYMGNGTFRSLGNILENGHIGLLFLELPTGLRMRVNGRAQVSDNPDWLAMFPGSVETVKVAVEEAYRQNRPAVKASEQTRFRERRSEDLDETLDETFPASDAPANTVETGIRLHIDQPVGEDVRDNTGKRRFGQK